MPEVTPELPGDAQGRTEKEDTSGEAALLAAEEGGAEVRASVEWLERQPISSQRITPDLVRQLLDGAMVRGSGSREVRDSITRLRGLALNIAAAYLRECEGRADAEAELADVWSAHFVLINDYRIAVERLEAVEWLENTSPLTGSTDA